MSSLLLQGPTPELRPAFSGAVFVPAESSARAAGGSDFLAGLADYSAAFDWPASYGYARSLLPEMRNLGQALRWAAALE